MQIRDNYKTALFCAVFPCALGFLLKNIRHLPDYYQYIAAGFFAASVLSIAVPKAGIFLHKYMSKAAAFIGIQAARIILFFVWIFTVLPLGLLMKLVKRDRLRLKKTECDSFWIDNTQQDGGYEYQF